MKNGNGVFMNKWVRDTQQTTNNNNGPLLLVCMNFFVSLKSK